MFYSATCFFLLTYLITRRLPVTSIVHYRPPIAQLYT